MIRPIRGLMAGSIIAAPLLSIAVLFSILAEIEMSTAGAFALAVFAGILTADLLSGMLHWACDSYGDDTTPWVGSTLIHSFREHHQFPTAMCDHDWIEVNGQAAVPVTFALVGISTVDLAESGAFLKTFLWSSFSFVGLTNQFHQWAHRRKAPRFVRFLQRWRLILSVDAHATHHSGDHLAGYCVSTGWLNPVLDRMGFWRALEWIVSRSVAPSAKRAR